MVSESLLIGGWVAMWRPIEVFLYEWWPIRAEARLYTRLSEMPVRLGNTRTLQDRPDELDARVRSGNKLAPNLTARKQGR